MSSRSASIDVGKDALLKKSTASVRVRDSKMLASHKHTEKQRRQKIQDRLLTLQCLVPACLAAVREKRRIMAGDGESAQLSIPTDLSGVSATKLRRRRRRKAANIAANLKEDKLNLNKLEILVHTIDYIIELQDQICTLETRCRPNRLSNKRSPRSETEYFKRKEKSTTTQVYDTEDESQELRDHSKIPEWHAIEQQTRGLKSNVNQVIQAPCKAIMSLSADSAILSKSTRH